MYSQFISIKSLLRQKNNRDLYAQKIYVGVFVVNQQKLKFN